MIYDSVSDYFIHGCKYAFFPISDVSRKVGSIFNDFIYYWLAQ